jgi:hypothetical protein
MQQITESRVMTCLAEDCSYNCRDECCAPAVEVGAEHPACDTFTTGAVSESDGVPPVQDCKVTDCSFNSSMSCVASGITMIDHSGHADCATYRK